MAVEDVWIFGSLFVLNDYYFVGISCRIHTLQKKASVYIYA